MAINAGGTDLTVSLVGEDETQQMLQQAQQNMAALENKIKSLTSATNQQATASRNAMGPMQGFNSKIAGVTGVANKALSGFDKITSTLGKIGGAAALAAAALELLKIGTGFIDDAIGKSKMELMAESLDKTRASSVGAMRAIDELAKVVQTSGNDIISTEIKMNNILSKQAKSRYDIATAMTLDLKNVKLSAHLEELKIEEELEVINIGRIRTSEQERDARDALGVATRRLAADEASLQRGPEKWISVTSDSWKATKKILEQSIAAGKRRVELERNLGSAARSTLGIFAKQTVAKRQLIDAQKASALQEAANTMISGIEGVMQKAVDTADAKKAKRQKKAVEQAAWDVKKDALAEKMWRNEVARDGQEARLYREKTERYGRLRAEIEALSRKGDVGVKGKKGGIQEKAANAEAERKDREDRKNIADEIQRELDEIQKNRDDEFDARRAAFEATKTAREEELAYELAIRQSFQDARDETRKNMEEERDYQRKLRDDSLNDLRDFSEAFSGAMTPELTVFSDMMSGITTQMDLFTEGKVTATQAMIQGGGEVAAQAARAILGIKEEMAIRSIMELGLGFANLANPFIAAGHFSAAAILGAGAVGLIGTPGDGAAKKSSDDRKAANIEKEKKDSESKKGSQGNGNTTINYNINAGMVDPQGVTRALRQAEQRSRGNGFSNSGGW